MVEIPHPLDIEGGGRFGLLSLASHVKCERHSDELRRKLVEDTAKWDESRKGEMGNTDVASKNLNESILKHSAALLLSAISETGLVCLPSLLTVVLLQANNNVSYEQVINCVLLQKQN